MDEKRGTAGQATDIIIRCMRFARWIPKDTNTGLEYVTFIFHYNNGYRNAPQCCVIRKLPLLFFFCTLALLYPNNSSLAGINVCRHSCASPPVLVLSLAKYTKHFASYSLTWVCVTLMLCICVFLRFVLGGYVAWDASPCFLFILEYLHLNRTLLSDSKYLLTNRLFCTVAVDMYKVVQIWPGLICV